MTLPRYIYEILPYLYISIGIALLISDVNLLARIAGVLLYFAGCCYWVLRSNYRREDRYIVRSKLTRFALSGPIYEAMPFLYILFGTMTLLWLTTALELISGLLLLSSGLLVWRLRYASRLEEHRHMVLRRKTFR